MTQKLTEEQQRSAHKIIVANRGDYTKESIYLDCHNCPRIYECDGRAFHVFSTKNFQTDNLRRSQVWLDEHSATAQEPPKRRPTPDEMVVGATVRVRLWDELVKDGVLSDRGNIQFPTIYFNNEMRQYCGNAYKVIKGGGYSRLSGCGDWTFIPEMLDYVEPEKVVEPKTTAVNFFDWRGEKVVFKDGRNNGAKYTVCSVTRDLALEGLFPFESTFIFKLLELEGLSYSARLFNLCETQDVAIEHTPDTLKIIKLENQVKDLTRKLVASERKCDRLARRLRAKWEASRDGEMATAEEIEAWHRSGNGVVIINRPSKILYNGHTDWIPATRGNLKL